MGPHLKSAPRAVKVRPGGGGQTRTQRRVHARARPLLGVSAGWAEGLVPRDKGERPRDLPVQRNCDYEATSVCSCLSSESPYLQFEMSSRPSSSHCAAFRASLLTQLRVRLPRACYLLHLYFAQESGEHLPDQIVLFVTSSRAVVWLHPQPGRGASKLCPLLGERPPFSLGTGPVAVGVGQRALACCGHGTVEHPVPSQPEARKSALPSVSC